jgi:hypothetical protein
MTDVWIDEVQEVPFKELTKIMVDYNNYVSLEFKNDNSNLFDRVIITRSYQETIQNKKETLTIHKKVSCILNCKISNHGKNKPASAYISDAKSFLYMLRLLKQECYLRFDLWPENNCSMFEEKGIDQETMIISIRDKNHNEKFQIKINEIHSTQYRGIPHLFRYTSPITEKIMCEV